MKSRYGSDDGDHSCIPYAGFGYANQTVECSEHWRTTNTGEEYVQFWDYFRPSAFVNGFPIGRTYDLHVNLHASGLLTFWNGGTKTGDNTP